MRQTSDIPAGASVWLQRRAWTLDDIRAVGHLTDEGFAEAVRTGEVAFSIEGREIKIGDRYCLLGGPCRVCGLPTGLPESVPKYQGLVCWTSRAYCTQRCAQRAYRERQRARCSTSVSNAADLSQAPGAPTSSSARAVADRLPTVTVTDR